MWCTQAGQLGFLVDVELAVEVQDMGLCRRHRDTERVGDVFVSLVFQQELINLAFACG